VGDVTFYHDMNGLLAIKRCGVPITIVLLNNNGGGIFYRLPVKDYDPAFTDLFVTPHGLDFSHAAHLYGVDYVQTTDRATFQQAFQQSVTERRSTIIEVRTDAQTDFARRNALVKAVQQALAGS
jgi:2-succinyl-5-enolpyruvyl-6-hydroxy-3-cyclohexene-1-carboxylate synthase